MIPSKPIFIYYICYFSGADAFGDFEWSSVEYMKKIMDVNVWQVVKITKNLIPLIRHSHYDARNRLGEL